MTTVHPPAARSTGGAFCRVWRSAAGTGAPRAGGLLLLGIAVLTGLGVDASASTPGWADPLNAGLVTTLFIAPVVTGSAAAQTGSLRRHGVTQVARTAPGGLARTRLLVLLAAAGWGVLALLVSTGVIVARADRSGSFTADMLLLPLSGLVYVVSASAVGAALGGLSDSRAVAPLLTLALFAGGYGISFAHGRWLLLSPTFPATFYTVATQPHAALLGAQMLLAASTGVLLLAVSGAGRRRRVTVGTALAVTALAVGVLTRVNPAPVEFRTAPNPASCASDARLSLCVWPEDRVYARPALAALATVTAEVGDYWPTARRYRELGIVRPVPNAAVYDITSITSTTAADYIPAAITAVLPPSQCAAPDRAVRDAKTDLYFWLESAAGAGPTDTGDTPVLSPPQRRTWVTTRLTVIDRCRPR